MSRTKSIDEEKMLQQNRKGSKIVTEVYESPAPDLAILNVIKGRRELLYRHLIDGISKLLWIVEHPVVFLLGERKPDDSVCSARC